MQIRRQEIRTGLLVVVSIGILTAVLLALGAPGVFKAVTTYHVFFDNAGGLKQGAPVMLAGRKIGQVTKLNSPVPEQDRPEKFKNYETLVEVSVDHDAEIFREVNVRMLSYSLLGELAIDFAAGNENSGRAPNGSYFIGERQKDFAQSISDAVDVIKNVVTPVALEAQKTMVELQGTAANLKSLTAPGSNVDQAVIQFRDLGKNLADLSGPNGRLQSTLGNLQEMTGPESPLHNALANVDKFTNDLANNKDIDISLKNFRAASDDLKSTMSTLGPQFTEIGHNLQQASETVKAQPWRLVWPSTKKYPGDPEVPRAIPAHRRAVQSRR